MSKSLYRIENALYNQIWCIKIDLYYSMIKQLQAHYQGAKTDFDFDNDLASGGNAIQLDIPSNTALVQVDGVIGKHLSLLETQCGGCDIDNVAQDLKAAAANPDIDYVLLYINSGGGCVQGIPETAALINEITQVKDVICYVDCMACSAAYWLASQCTAIYCSPTAILGNVGAYNIFVDETAFLEKEGIFINCIASDPLKIAGASWVKMSDEIKEKFKSQVMSTTNDFRAAIKSKTSGSRGCSNRMGISGKRSG